LQEYMEPNIGIEMATRMPEGQSRASPFVRQTVEARLEA
jgi:hypothetical protein